MDYDVEEAKRKRKNMEERREYAQAHDTRGDPAVTKDEQVGQRRPAQEIDRLRGRGSGPARIEVIQGMQKTHGNRAVQRLFGDDNKGMGSILGGTQTSQMDDKAGGSSLFPSIGTAGKIGQGILGGIATVLGNLVQRDPMVEQMWRASVVMPIQTAAEALKNVHGSETEKIEALKQIREQLRDARLVVREIKEMLEEAGVNPTLVMRLKASINGLGAVDAGISTHIPEKEEPGAARMMLEMYLDEAKALGDRMIEETPPYNPITSKPAGPARPAADNPMATKLWHTTVVQPLEKAIKRLKGHPTKQQLTEALQDVNNAKRTLDYNMIMSWGKPALSARVDKVSQYLLVVVRIIEDKLGKEAPLEELSGELTMRGIPMEYMVDEVSLASGQVAAAARDKKAAGDDDANTDTK